jgi:ferredoxin-NADP reductase
MFITVTIQEKTYLTDDVIELVVRPEEYKPFIPGQFLNFNIPGGQRPQIRAYSIANHPKDADAQVYRFLIKLVDGGIAGEFLKTATLGDTFQVMKPAGVFTFKSAQASHVYMLCTGTGLAPFVAMASDELAKNTSAQFSILFGSRYPKDIFYTDYLQELTKKYPNFSYTTCVSRPDDTYTGAIGYVQNLLTDEIDYTQGHFYLCGVPAMIDDVKRILIEEKGVAKERIFEEKYTSPGKALASRS